MITIAIVLTIVLLPLAAFLISIKRADISTRPKHASFNLKRVRQVIAGWLIADVERQANPIPVSESVVQPLWNEDLMSNIV